MFLLTRVAKLSSILSVEFKYHLGITNLVNNLAIKWYRDFYTRWIFFYPSRTFYTGSAERFRRDYNNYTNRFKNNQWGKHVSAVYNVLQIYVWHKISNYFYNFFIAFGILL